MVRNGHLGFLATNTIAQGDTRETGLDVIVAQGGAIYDATTDVPWGGDAAVTVIRPRIALSGLRNSTTVSARSSSASLYV